jgi:hypothetical protein
MSRLWWARSVPCILATIWQVYAMNKKSIWAVVAGLLVIIIVTIVVDIVLHAIRVFPPMDQPINDAQALLATFYRLVISVGGAWLTARLAPYKPMKHALILGCVGTVLGLVGVVATWNLDSGQNGTQSLSPYWRYRSVGSAARSTSCSRANHER